MSESGMDTYKYEMTVIRDGVPIRTVTVEKQAMPVDEDTSGPTKTVQAGEAVEAVETADAGVQTAPKNAKPFPSSSPMMNGIGDDDIDQVKGLMSSLFAFNSEAEKNAMDSLVGSIIDGLKGGEVTNEDGKIDLGKMDSMMSDIEKDQKDHLSAIKKPVLDKFKIE